MNFDEFKRRYIAKMEAVGFVFDEEDAGFHDRMAEAYLALMVYSEYQNEQAKKQYEELKKRENEPLKQIYVPGREH